VWPTVPRLFYKVVVASAFVLASIALIAAEVVLIGWLVDRYPSVSAWIGYVLLSLVDVGVFIALWNRALRRIRAA
jgi:hypothetical protein